MEIGFVVMTSSIFFAIFAICNFSGVFSSVRHSSSAQQTDILPTILGIVGYDKPYLAFGSDLLNTPQRDLWAINYLDGTYQYCKGDYVLQFDGEKTIGLYRLTDYVMKHNLKGSIAEETQMEREIKAVIQQYVDRMIDNQLHP